MISPSIGRIVWYTPSQTDAELNRVSDQKLAGIVTYVHSDRLVNLAVFDPNGHPFSRTSVKLLQDDDEASAGGGYAEWMPFQKGQAKRYESEPQAA